MSVDQLIEEVAKLSDSEREILFAKLGRWHETPQIEETPEFIAFLEEGIRSAEEDPLIPIEQVMEKIKTWNTKSF